MSNPDIGPETPQERAEARALRRRWISIGEAVAVAGVVIAGLGFWNSYQERQDAAAERAATRAAEAGAKAEEAAALRRVRLVTGTVDARGLELAAQEGCALQSTDIRFPAAMGVATRSTVVTHRIEAEWIAAPLLKATDGGADRQEGRLPILIAATCAAADGDHRETAIYDLLWKTEPGGVLSGRSLRLRGLVRRERGGDARRLDALWKGV